MALLLAGTTEELSAARVELGAALRALDQARHDAAAAKLVRLRFPSACRAPRLPPPQLARRPPTALAIARPAALAPNARQD